MYNSDLLKPYLEAKYSNNIPFKNSELYSLCGCTTDNQKASIRSLKSRYLKEFESKKPSETSETEIFQKSKLYTNPEVKDRFHEVLELINKYPELPLFMYSKLYEKTKEEYVLTGTLTFSEMEALEIDSDIEFNNLTYSFYDMYMELFEDINKGNYDQEIEAYMKDVIKSLGKLYCSERYNLPFEREKLEERTYWSEDEAKEWLEKHLLENPEYSRKYNLDLEKINDHDKKRAKEMVEEGSYEVDYSDVIESLSDIISKTLDQIPRMLDLFESLTNDSLRVIPLIYLMFDLEPYNIFDERPNEYIRGDILKLFTYMKRNKIPLGYIPNICEDASFYDLLREYDERWLGMNEPEKFLQYKTNPTEEQETIPESVHDNSEIIDKLETEFERLKGSS